MKQITGFGCLLLVLSIGGFAQAKPAKAQAAPIRTDAVRIEASPFEKAPWWVKTPVITQIGYVRTEIEANRAYFNAQFQTVGKTPAEAQNKAIEQTRALSNVLKKLGAEKVRVTTSFSMRTLYEQYRDKAGNRIEDQRADKIDAYQVSQSIALEIKDTAVLERAYALVLAANPTSASQINFNLVPTNETKTWLYGEAMKDALRRAKLATDAAGANLGKALVIDPTSRACQTDVLARNFTGEESADYAQDVMVTGTRKMAYAPPPPPPAPMMAMEAMSAEQRLEEQALKNPFIQTPPMRELTAQACVVYGLN